MERDSTKYFGRTATVFVPLSLFEFTNSYLRAEFAGWASVESFEQGETSLPFLTQGFRLEGADFLEFRETNKQVFDEMTSAILKLVYVPPEEWELEHFQINITERVLTIIALKNGSGKLIRTMPNHEFDDAIAQNSELVSTVLNLNWMLATTKSEWLSKLEIN